MKKSFNLKNFYKQAYYEDGRGLFNRNSRAWPNCLKTKMDGKNKSKQEAYSECTKEYNEWSREDWNQTYCECHPDSGNVRIDLATPGSRGLTEIKRKKK